MAKVKTIVPAIEKFSTSATILRIGKMEIFYSYETAVAFTLEGQPLVFSENLWGQTTAKHLNLFKARKGATVGPVERGEFMVWLQDELADAVADRG